MRRTIVISCSLLILGLSSCSRKVGDPDVLPDPPPTPYNLGLGYGQQAVTLSWEISDAAAVSRYRVYVGDSTEDNYVLRDSTAARTITITGLQYNRTYAFTVAAVGSDKIEGLRATPVTTRLPLLGITIEDAAPYTRTHDVNIALTAVNATHVYLSEDSTFAGVQAMNFASSRPFTLSSADGVKHVYARFLFADGGLSTGTITDDITLDTKATIDSVSFQPPGLVFSAGDIIIFMVAASEVGGAASVSFGEVQDYSLYDDGTDGDLTADDGTYAATYVVPVNIVVSNQLVSGTFTDAAGNTALVRSSTVPLNIQPAPQAPKLNKPEALSTFEIRIGWSESPSGNIEFYRLYRDIQRNVTNASTLVTSVAAGSSLSYTDTSLTDNTKYFYKVFAIAGTGASAASNVDSATTLVNTPPTPVVLAGALSDTATVDLSWSENGDSDFRSYRVYRRTSSPVDTLNGQLISLINSQATTSVSNNAAELPTVYYRVFVFDRHGLASGSNTIQISK